MSYTRFAVYFVPSDGPLARFGARWLGWDVGRGRATPQFDLDGLEEVTRGPRKYGLHATLKPPFRLAQGVSPADLERAVSAVAARETPAIFDALAPEPLGRFLSLRPRGDATGLHRIAAACVRDLDAFRAPPDAAELERRRGAGLSPRREALLAQWGFPYVMEEFRFHITLTGRLPKGALPLWSDRLRAHLPAMPAPFILDQIALCGERADERFEVIQQHILTG